jgi:hypothetical protein
MRAMAMILKLFIAICTWTRILLYMNEVGRACL